MNAQDVLDAMFLVDFWGSVSATLSVRSAHAREEEEARASILTKCNSPRAASPRQSGRVRFSQGVGESLYYRGDREFGEGNSYFVFNLQVGGGTFQLVHIGTFDRKTFALGEDKVHRWPKGVGDDYKVDLIKANTSVKNTPDQPLHIGWIVGGGLILFVAILVAAFGSVRAVNAEREAHARVRSAHARVISARHKVDVAENVKQKLQKKLSNVEQENKRIRKESVSSQAKRE